MAKTEIVWKNAYMLYASFGGSRLIASTTCKFDDIHLLSNSWWDRCLFGENYSFSGVDSLRVYNEEEKLVLKRMKQLFENDKKQ